MIKTVIFDCFGVLVQANMEAFISKYLHDADKIREAMAQETLSNKGLLSYDDFLKALAELAGIPFKEVFDFMETNPPNLSLFDYIKSDLKPKYKIGLLSNASDNWLDELFTPEQMELFNAFTLSYDSGFAKPQAQIYEIMADKLGVRLDECVFTDDRQEYIDGAVAVGMKAILFKSTKQFKTDLNVILSS